MDTSVLGAIIIIIDGYRHLLELHVPHPLGYLHLSVFEGIAILTDLQYIVTCAPAVAATTMSGTKPSTIRDIRQSMMKPRITLPMKADIHTMTRDSFTPMASLISKASLQVYIIYSYNIV